MMKTKASVLVAAVALVALYSLRADDAKAPKLDGLKCPISGKAVVAEGTADYKGGKVYFCCQNCPKAFAKDPAKYGAKANHQLVATGQAKQAACPFTGGKLNPETKITVDGAAVCFCCNNCKGKAEKMKADEIFTDANFAKAKYTVAK